MQAKGQLASVGLYPNLTRLFYYSAGVLGVFIELIDRRNRDLKHLLVLVDAKGTPVTLPDGCRFAPVESLEQNNLLENHLYRLSHERQEAKA